jgi:hypothetical protein
MPTKKIKVRDQSPSKDPKGGKHKHHPTGGISTGGTGGPDGSPPQVPGNPPIRPV